MILKRRDFLKAVAVSAGALVVGCGPKNNDNGDPNNSTNNNTNNDPNNMTTGTNNNVDPCAETLQDGTQFFPQSVASGDPTDSTVILWTRVEDGAGDRQLELQVALDAEFEQRLELGDDGCSLALNASAAYDNCLKVRLTGLDPATHYYYRFVYEKDGTRYGSRVGRTKTAPAPDADVAAKFAFVSCQDFNGKYFNSYKQLVKDEAIDFVVHLGDYIYETTGDPQFQTTTPDRVVNFTDQAGAIVFNEGTEDEYYAASSLSNYRDIHRIYRSDEWLQRAHELYPFVIIWDDHEFSDDCWGANATYFDGREDELDEARRKNANQAWFEYMPVDYLDDPEFAYDATAPYGQDIRIYRDIRWGAHTHLVMTDLRSYRADHVIAEDLFPGTVLMTQTELEAAVGATLPAWADPYVDVATFGGGIYQMVLTDAAPAVGYDPSLVTGNLSVSYINAIVAAVNETLPMNMQVPAIDPAAAAESGLTAWSMGKRTPTGQLGSRYFVIEEPFGVYAAFRYANSGGASEEVLGADQEAWFLSTMQGSDATWKVWGNEFVLSQRKIDLTSLVGQVGPAFANRYLLSAEDWDGARNKRDELIEQLADIGNVVAITGDIHAFFAGTPLVMSDPSRRIVEFVTGAISSSSMKTLLVNTASADPNLAAAGAATLAMAISSFLFMLGRPNPPLAWGNVDHAGFSVIEADGATLTCTFHQMPEAEVALDTPQDMLDAVFTTRAFTVNAGSPELYRENGTERWDPTTIAWIPA